MDLSQSHKEHDKGPVSVADIHWEKNLVVQENIEVLGPSLDLFVAVALVGDKQSIDEMSVEEMRWQSQGVCTAQIIIAHF